MKLRAIELKNFRCFTHRVITLDQPLVLIEGYNGSGKTSLLEAIHYGCYLRSFRTHIPSTMITHDQEAFFVKLEINEEHDIGVTHHTIHVGFSGKRRSVKCNGHPICSYKELMDSFRVITLTEDDVALVGGGPDERRTFIDQALVLSNPLGTQTLSELRRIVDQRTSLIAHGCKDMHVYRLWTQQLWNKSRAIQDERCVLLDKIHRRARELINHITPESFNFDIHYKSKINGDTTSFDNWFDEHSCLCEHEKRMGRCLFGAHLDDFTISFQQANSRLYASRGQQKFIVFLIKLALVHEISSTRGPVIVLFDDFMTDFDHQRVDYCLQLLAKLPGQVILTTPQMSGFLSTKIQQAGGQKILL